MVAVSRAVQVTYVINGQITSHANCDLKQNEAEMPHHGPDRDTRLAHRSHMADRVLSS